METSSNQENILHEILEFGVTVVWLGIAFGIALAGGAEALPNLGTLKNIIIESLVVVFFAFVFHELAHRIVSRRFGFKAVYHVSIPGLVLALAASLIGFLFAVPGGVHIPIGPNTADNRAKLGKSALVGPIANIVLAIVFAGLSFALYNYADSLIPTNVVSSGRADQLINIVWGICIIGVEINAWLAFFNLLPFGTFDGYKVFQWNKVIWGIAFVGSIAIYGLMYWAQTKCLA